MHAIPAVLEQHFEALAQAWETRHQARASADCSLAELEDLNDAIECHVQGLLLGGTESESLLLERLAGDSAPELSAAAYVLLRRGDPSVVAPLLDLFLQADGAKWAWLAYSLCCGSVAPVADRLKEIYEQGPPLPAAMAAEIFAHHARFRSGASRLSEFLSHEDPLVRTSAWHVVALVDGRESQ